MKRSLSLPALALLLFVSSCSQDDDSTTNSTAPPVSTALNTIMPLGASRVEGGRPHYESFRYELWKSMVDGGWNFDYIGTRKDEASYPDHVNTPFDADHEGRGGWTSGEILNGLGTWIRQAGAPDIVLLSSPGGNDALQALPYNEAIANVNSMIDLLQTANPNVTIIIEQLAPARSDFMTPALNDYFIRMRQDVVTIANEQSTTTSRVITVDMATNFTDSYYADETHYNEAGAKEIANRYYSVLQAVLKR